MQKSVRYNEGHALYLALLARKEGTKRGYLSKKTAETNRWHEKWFALYQNVLFYFEGEQSARPAGMYMLEGCNCERVAAPKGCAAGSARDAALDKQVPPRGPGWRAGTAGPAPRTPGVPPPAVAVAEVAKLKCWLMALEFPRPVLGSRSPGLAHRSGCALLSILERHRHTQPG